MIFQIFSQELDFTTQILRDACGVTLSPGVVVGMIRTAAGNLIPTVAHIADAVRNARVAHFDETGVRVAGKLHWLHTAATPNMTWVGMHTRRGQEAFDAFGILPGFQRTAIHDGWAPYRKYDCLHGLCNAHHLRELTCIHELHGQRWAKNMIDLSVAANRDVADGPPSDDRMVQINADYTAILWLKATQSIQSRNARMAPRTGVNPLRPICCDACVNIVRMSCVSSRIRRCPSPTRSQNRRCGCPRLNRRSPAVSGPLMGQQPSARSDPIWKTDASRASICCTRWFTLFRGKPRSPPWGNCTSGEQLRYSMPPVGVSDVL